MCGTVREPRGARGSGSAWGAHVSQAARAQRGGGRLLNLTRAVGQAPERRGGWWGEQRRPWAQERAENGKCAALGGGGFSLVMAEVRLCADDKAPVKTGTLIGQREGDRGRSQVLE